MAKRRAHRVVWGEGLLVCPQHFQQQELYFHELVEARSTWPNAYAWGLTGLELDAVALKTGEFGIKSIQAVLPGGIAVDLDEGDPGLPGTRPIGAAFESTAAVLEVFAGVPHAQEGSENYGPADTGATPRSFEMWSRDVLDLVDAATEVSVSFARPKLAILFGSENRDHFHVIKIAELRRDDSGGFELTTDFVPTCQRLSGSKALRTWTSDLLKLMVAKRRAISGALRQVDSSRVEFTAQDVTRSLQLAAIAAQIPLVRHFSESPEASPFELYKTLSQLAGHLTTFSADIAPEELPTYNHGNLRETFSELYSKLRSLLELAMAENFLEVTLEARRDGMWIAMLKDQRLLDCPVFVLALDANAPQQDVANRVPHLSKVASWKQIPKIVRSAIPGAPIKASHRPPPEVPIRPHEVYFVIDTSHEYWEQILREKTIAIFLPPPFDSSRAKARLFAIPTASRK